MRIILLLGTLFFFLNTFGQAPDYVPTSGLLAWYPFNGNTIDESFNGNNGTINGGVSLSVDRFGNADSSQLFDGQQLTYINCGNDASLTITNGGNLTVSAWVRTNGSTAFPARQVVLSKNSSFSQNIAGSYTLWLDSGVPQFTLSNENGNPNWYQTASGTDMLDNGTWYFLTGVIDAASGEIRVYVNGALAGTDTWSGTIDSDISTDLLIGCHYKSDFAQGYVYNFGGEIDDVALWNRVIDECEIQDLYHAQTNSLNGISQNGSQLTADISGGTYQWLDCENSFAELLGETNQFYNVTENGNYSVEVTSNGCTDTTSCIFVDFTGVNNEYKNTLAVYPNPTSEILHVKNIHEINGLEMLEITNSVGQVVYKTIVVKEEIDVTSLPKGIYFLNIIHENGIEKVRFVKK